MWLDKKVCLKGNSGDEDHEQKFKVTKLAETNNLRKSIAHKNAFLGGILC